MLDEIGGEVDVDQHFGFFGGFVEVAEETEGGAGDGVGAADERRQVLKGSRGCGGANGGSSAAGECSLGFRLCCGGSRPGRRLLLWLLPRR